MAEHWVKPRAIYGQNLSKNSAASLQHNLQKRKTWTGRCQVFLFSEAIPVFDSYQDLFKLAKFLSLYQTLTR